MSVLKPQGLGLGFSMWGCERMNIIRRTSRMPSSALTPFLGGLGSKGTLEYPRLLGNPDIRSIGRIRTRVVTALEVLDRAAFCRLCCAFDGFRSLGRPRLRRSAPRLRGASGSPKGLGFRV